MDTGAGSAHAEESEIAIWGLRVSIKLQVLHTPSTTCLSFCAPGWIQITIVDRFFQRVARVVCALSCTSSSMSQRRRGSRRGLVCLVLAVAAGAV